METASLNAEVERAARFFQVNLDGDVRVQVLRFLAAATDHSWTADSVARELGVASAEAAKALDHLCTRNLLDVRISAELHFRYNPGSEALRDEATAFLDVLDHKPLELAKRLAEQRQEQERAAALQVFVDAFLLRNQEKKDG
ncbi:MAG TPA: hypothetical protein VIG99_18555 [Myxococcaceae bacterium]|jgi:AraC-like DNA-binding protein